MKLHDYQSRSADNLYCSTAMCAILQMGAGKTLLSLIAIADGIDAGDWDRAIVFAPKRVAQLVWAAEQDKFPILSDLNLVTLTGKTPKQRVKLLEQDWQILVVNYELAEWLRGQGVVADDRTVVVFDEVTRMKNAKGRRRKHVVKIVAGANSRWGLTGTPKPNGPIDLWGIADILQPGIWGNFYEWRAKHFRPVDRDGHMWKVLPGMEGLIDAEFAKLSFKIDENEIPQQPPIPLVDSVILPPAAMRQYREFEEELIFELGEDLDITAESAAAVSMKCRQIASGFVYDEDMTSHWVHDAKMDALQDIIDDSGDNVLVFYQFLPEIAAMRERWPDMAVLGGETSDRQAVDIVERWNRGDIPVLAGHPAAMGHGLNLQQGGRRCVWYSLPWDLEGYEQAMARLARQGQTRQVYAHHLVAAGTVDMAVYRALREKRSMQDALMEIVRIAA